MEDVLAKLMKDASPIKHIIIRQSCLETQELLANQHELMRSPPSEIRSKCLETFKLALESKHSKLISHALNGLQRLVWDKSFQTVFESDDEETWLPCQLLSAVVSIANQHDDIQLEILKILLQMTSTNHYNLTSKVIIKLIQLCSEVYNKGSSSVRTAAQATANQTLQSFCMMLQEPDGNAEEAEDPAISQEDNNFNLLDGVIEDLLPILSFICVKLKSQSSDVKSAAPLLLQCTLSVLKNLKIEVHKSQLFLNFLWQELCPRLVALLGSPKTDKNIVSSQKSTSSDGNQIGRGSGCLATAPSCHSAEAKTIYSIAIQLVGLVGNVASLRPMLESLFHRMLLYPAPQHRLEALKAVKELMHQPALVLKFAGPPIFDTTDKTSRSCDLDLIRIAVDSLGECCHSSDGSVCYMSVSCATELLKSLEELCKDTQYLDNYAAEINCLFKTLESADYNGVKSDRWLQTRGQTTSVEIPVSAVSSEYSDSEISAAKDDEQDEDKSIEDIPDETKEDDECETTKTKPEKCDETEEFEEANDDNEEKKKETVSDDAEEIKAAGDNVPAIIVSKVLESDSKDAALNTADVELETNLEDDDIIDGIRSLPAVEFISNGKGEDVEEVEIDHNDEPSEDFNSSSTSLGTSILPNENDILEDLEDHERELEQQEADRLNKVPRSLHGMEDAGKLERERVERLCESHFQFAQQERKNAQHFVEVLSLFLPKLLAIRSSVEADQALQEFASNYCEGLWQQQQTQNEENDGIVSHITILNADGIYLALYSALLLNLKLIRSGYYLEESAVGPSLTEEQFVEEVHGTGVLVYLSATWLAELYQHILSVNLLEASGYAPNSSQNSALVNLLSDVDGLGNSQPGGQQLADYRRLERAVVNVQSSPNIEAGRKFARRILSSSWETILEVLSVLLNGTNSCGITSTIGFLLGMEGAKEEHRRTKDAIAESLDGLQRAAKLCNALGLQSSCSAIFAQLAATACPLSEESSHNSQAASKKVNRLKFRKNLLIGKSRTLRVHTSHAFSMEVMLSRGLELGSHSPSCWKYVFQCCLYVLELENAYFGNYRSIQSVLAKPALQVLKKVVEKGDSLKNDPTAIDDNSVSDLLPMPGSAVPQNLNITEIIKKNPDADTSGVIKDQILLEVIEGLSQRVDRLFEEAASRLNLSALIGFLVELCASSQIQLFTSSYRQSTSSGAHGNSLLLYHLGDIMMRCARGGRPLIHVMKVWSVVAPHFVEAACHKDRLISKKAVTMIHDIVSALLSSNSELLHFHFNEALFKPFENLLCLELCDTDVQEQIFSSICEFVEGCTTEIRSGWRPLFGALRSVRLPAITSRTSSLETEREHENHLRVVLDVFEAFLGTDNILVFANAAVDCLLCLLKHVKGPSEDITCSMEDVPEEGIIPLDMSLAALKYLNKCSSILASMYKMPTCPVFNSANRIQMNSVPSTVDPDIIYYYQYCDGNFNGQYKQDLTILTNKINEEDMGADSLVSLKNLDNHTGILHVWFLLIEGLAGAMGTCPRRYQPHTMEALFEMLRNMKDVPGAFFGIYCINHLVLPMLQSWMRRISHFDSGWNGHDTNFKQCCGLTTDLAVDYIQHVADTHPKSSEVPGNKFMLQQLFIVLTECIAQSSETISRLGCACIRHIILSAGRNFTSDLWDIACTHVQKACYISLHNIKQLMVCFHTDSENFYGDLMEVKVAARRDCTKLESERLQQLAHQVFLLDCQRGFKGANSVSQEDEERSYVFLLHPPVTESSNTSEDNIIRVPFRNLVVCLLSHQILLQILSTILLHGSRHLLPGLMTLLLFLSLENPDPSRKNGLPGFLPDLSFKQLSVLFHCLKDSYKTACDFDARPGLKFLIQKVAKIDVAANLYKQTGVSWTAYTLSLFELCLCEKDLTKEIVNAKLAQQNDEGDSPNFFIILMQKFKDICELYSECAMDKDGLLATVDRMADQPIFFLVAQPDSITELTRRTSEADETMSKSSAEPPVVEDSSDSEEPVIEDDCKDKVYSLATEQTISTLINEYKKRKIRHAMPSTIREKLQRKSRSFEKSPPCDEFVPEEIVKQRRASITKDGEAHIQVFKQLVQSVLDLHLSLPEDQFQSFLPVFFPGVQYLVAYATDSEVKMTIAEWLQKVASCCGFGGNSRNFNLSS